LTDNDYDGFFYSLGGNDVLHYAVLKTSRLMVAYSVFPHREELLRRLVKVNTERRTHISGMLHASLPSSKILCI
jgi:hypothetical protein